MSGIAFVSFSGLRRRRGRLPGQVQRQFLACHLVGESGFGGAPPGTPNRALDEERLDRRVSHASMKPAVLSGAFHRTALESRCSR